MITFILYLMKVSVVLIILFGFYQLALKRTTFFQLNRLYLLFVLIGSFALPLINFQLPSPRTEMDSTIHEFNEAIVHYESSVVSAVSDPDLPTSALGPVVVILYLAGVLIFLFRMSNSIMRLIKLHRRPLEPAGFRLVGGNLPSFTFLRSVFIHEKHTRSPELPIIVAHENVHCKEMHTIDLLIAEIGRCLLWFNPVVRSIQKAILQNHEYLADQATIRRYPDLTNYVNLMLASASGTSLGISNAFNFTNINNRITMITKVKTQKYQAAVYLFVLPILVIISMAFSPRWNPVSDLAAYPASYQDKNPEFQWPIEKSGVKVFKITATFKMMNNPILKKEMMHHGLDIVAPRGTGILAAEAGRVIKAEYDEKYGKYVVVNHSASYSTLYAHLSSIDVSVGEDVSAGEAIGKLGNTGQSTGPHLHFEIRQNDIPLDPEQLLQ